MNLLNRGFHEYSFASPPRGAEIKIKTGLRKQEYKRKKGTL